MRQKIYLITIYIILSKILLAKITNYNYTKICKLLAEIFIEILISFYHSGIIIIISYFISKNVNHSYSIIINKSSYDYT